MVFESFIDIVLKSKKQQRFEKGARFLGTPCRRYRLNNYSYSSFKTNTGVYVYFFRVQAALHNIDYCKNTLN